MAIKCVITAPMLNGKCLDWGQRHFLHSVHASKRANGRLKCMQEAFKINKNPIA